MHQRKRQNTFMFMTMAAKTRGATTRYIKAVSPMITHSLKIGSRLRSFGMVSQSFIQPI